MKQIVFLLSAILTAAVACSDSTETQGKGGAPGTSPGLLTTDSGNMKTRSGLEYRVLSHGTSGPYPTLADKVKIHITGRLEDGTVFQSSAQSGSPQLLKLSETIPGLAEGLQLMTPGSTFRFIVPPELAYGRQGMSRIPPNATLIFEVDLLSIEKGPPMPVFRKGNPDAQQTAENGLVYEVIAPGTGEAPKEGDTVHLKYAFWNEEGMLCDCSELQPQVMKFVLGQAKLKFLNEGPKLLKEGAHLRFEVPPELGFGDRGAPPNVPPKGVTIWELELVEIVKPMPVPDFSLPVPEKLKATANGLGYEILKEGTGQSPRMGDMVEVHYAGWLQDGSLFDSSFQRGETMLFRVGQVIPGWNEGLQLMKEGAVYKLIIPGNLAYGPRGMPPKIPPDATLIFHVELVKVGE